MTHPAELERHDLRIGTSNPHRSSWDWDRPYLGPPEEGQPRAGTARPAGPDTRAPRPASEEERTARPSTSS